MSDLNMTNAEQKLSGIIWDTEPIASPKLCALAEERLGWKRTTTYTVLKKLCKKGVMRNAAATVTSVIGRDAAQKLESRTVMEKSFGGSLPVFLNAFLSGKKISAEEAEQLKRLIDCHREK